jgi:peptide/nickel transport system substrate-binding protein
VSRTFAVDVITDGPTYSISYLEIPEDENSDNGTLYPVPYTASPEQQAEFDKAVTCDGNTITFNLKVFGCGLQLHRDPAVVQSGPQGQGHR